MYFWIFEIILIIINKKIAIIDKIINKATKIMTTYPGINNNKNITTSASIIIK